MIQQSPSRPMVRFTDASPFLNNCYDESHVTTVAYGERH